MGEKAVSEIIRDYVIPLFFLFVVLFPVILNKPQVGLWFICFLIPISPTILIGQTEVREITLRFEDIIFAIVALMWFLRFGLSVPKTGAGYRIFRLLLFFALLHAFSTFIFFSKKAQIFFLLKYIQYWSYFIFAYSLIKDERDFKFLLVAYFLGISLALIYWLGDISQGKTGNAIRFPFHEKFAGRENVGIFAFGVMSFSLPFFLSSRGLKKFFFLLFFAISAIVYFRTLSRASYLAGIAWIIFTLIFLRRKDLFLMVLFIVALSPFILPDYVIERIKYTFTGSGGGEILGNIYVESSGFVRVERWKYFLFDQLPQNIITFLFGYGAFGLGLMDSQYFRVWGEVGTIGFILFLIILKNLWRIYFEVYRNLPNDEYLKPASVGMICWFVGILFHMIPANTLVILQTSEMFWLMSGAIAALERIMTEKQQKGES